MKVLKKKRNRSNQIITTNEINTFKKQISELKKDFNKISKQISEHSKQISEIKKEANENSKKISELIKDAKEKSKQISEIKKEANENEKMQKLINKKLNNLLEKITKENNNAFSNLYNKEIIKLYENSQIKNYELF